MHTSELAQVVTLRMVGPFSSSLSASVRDCALDANTKHPLRAFGRNELAGTQRTAGLLHVWCCNVCMLDPGVKEYNNCVNVVRKAAISAADRVSRDN